MITRLGKLITLEGVWGAGKSTACRLLGERLRQQGFRVATLHYGERTGVVGELSRMLDEEPLRIRTGPGGFEKPWHARVDVLLRLGREAYDHHQLFLPALETHDVVVLDRGIDTIWAYSLAILKEQQPDPDELQLFRQIEACSNLWALKPDRTFFIDTPWPLARERANLRGTPQSLERLLFMPKLDAAWRTIIREQRERFYVVKTHLGSKEDVLAEIERETLRVLGA